MNEKNYSLRTPDVSETEMLEDFKMKSFLGYAKNLSDIERSNIANHVSKSVSENLSHYKMIEMNDEIVGCYMAKKEDGMLMLDDLFVKENHRGQGIGSDMIKNLQDKHDEIELWVDKDNYRAIKLYECLKFDMIGETKNRLHMIYKKNKHI